MHISVYVIVQEQKQQFTYSDFFLFFFFCRGIMELVGILIGHLYFFLVFKYPLEFGGPALLSTPSIM